VLSNLYVLFVTFELNFTNFTQNWLIYAFDPYTSLFANMTWGILFGFIGAGIYVGSRSVQAVFTYLVVVGLIFGIILPSALAAIFVFILTFMGASALYIVFVSSRGR